MPVSPVPDQPALRTGPVRIFTAYSRKDADLLEELRTHLAPMRRAGKIELFYDLDILPGTQWEPKLFDEIDRAEIFVIFLSPNLLASDYVQDIEIPRALEHQSEGRLRIVPIIARPCAWLETDLKRIQGLPRDTRPVVTWRDRDEAWVEIARELNGLVIALRPR